MSMPRACGMTTGWACHVPATAPRSRALRLLVGVQNGGTGTALECHWAASTSIKPMPTYGPGATLSATSWKARVSTEPAHKCSRQLQVCWSERRGPARPPWGGNTPWPQHPQSVPQPQTAVAWETRGTRKTPTASVLSDTGQVNIRFTL